MEKYGLGKEYNMLPMKNLRVNILMGKKMDILKNKVIQIHFMKGNILTD